MSIKRLKTALASSFLISLAACSGSEGDAGPDRAHDPQAVRLLAPADFEEAIREPDRTSINVHVPFEGELLETDLAIPYDQILVRQSRLPSDRSTPMAVYCKSGRMSAEAAQSLAELGYTDVVDLAGGMDAWEASGRRLLTTQPFSE